MTARLHAFGPVTPITAMFWNGGYWLSSASERPEHAMLPSAPGITLIENTNGILDPRTLYTKFDQFSISRSVLPTSVAMSERSSTDPINGGYDQAQLNWLDSKKLCDQCQSIFGHWYARDNWESERPDHRHHTLLYLQESARCCPICELWMVGLQDEVVGARLADPEERGLVRVKRGPFGDCFNCALTFSTVGPKPALSSHIELNNTMLEGDDSTTVGAVNEYSDCEASWKLARRWLKSCTETHSCDERITELKLPSRLIDVGKEEGQARLCLGTDLPADIQYLTLSHCWGQKKFTTLLCENMETFYSGIPNSVLSKTFKDAMKATRELGFRYLWIDSLCIVQDDDKDWSEHAPLMGSIYSNSVLNLSATDSVDGDGGLFFCREARKVYCWKLNLKNEHGSMDSQVSKLWLCCPENFECKHWGDDVLSARAWTCQERCLAPRSLAFGQKELAWECREYMASETLPNGFNSVSATIPGILTSLRWPQLTAQSLLKVWDSIVSDYSKGKLTYWSDKLVAISGIARLVKQQFDMHYLAGLWREYMVRQLVWYTRVASVSPTDRYQAPSWSWAAVNSQVFNYYYITRGEVCIELAVVEEAYVTSMGNPFDEVSGGSLMLRCPYFGSGSTIRIIRKSHIEWCLAGISPSVVFPDYEPHKFYGQLFYLPLLLWEENVRDSWELHGLVLKLSTPEKYIRVGCFQVRDVENIKLFLSKLSGRPVTTQELMHADLLSSKEGDGKTWRMITVV